MALYLSFLMKKKTCVILSIITNNQARSQGGIEKNSYNFSNNPPPHLRKILATPLPTIIIKRMGKIM